MMSVLGYVSRVPQQINQFFQPRARLWLLTILVAATPALVSVILVTSSGAAVSDFIPTWNDEVSYWHQVLTFKEVGFQGGYYTVNELPPAAGFTHFYTYGPWYPMVYGSIARVIGWDFTTVLIVNALLLALALVVFCRAAHLDGWQLIITGLMLATFWGLLLYLFTAFQEAFQQSLAILLAAVFYRAFTKRENSSIKFRVIGFLVIAAAAVTRMSWAILFLPFLLVTGRKSFRHWIFALSLSILATLVVVGLAQYTGAPGNNSIFTMVSNFSVSFDYGWSQLWDYFFANVWEFLYKDPLDMIQSLQVIGVLLGGTAVSIVLYRHGKRTASEALFYVYNLGAILFASCLLYVVGSFGDYRVLATHLMIILLLLVALRRTRIVLLIVATNLVFVSVFLHGYQTMTVVKFNPDHSEYEAFREVANDTIHYEPDASNPWCNTLLFSVWDYLSPVLGVPAGIGQSFYFGPDESLLTFKSQYILLSDDDFRVITTRSNAPQLEFLASTPGSTLYRNLTSGCHEG